MRAVSLAIALILFWLALSGHYTAFLITMGIIASLATVYVARRMEALDGESVPVELIIPALTYWPWLVVEIWKSAIGVARIVIDPKLPISPTMTKVRVSQRSAAGIATYANSITLTPGTVTTLIEGDVLTVHAIVRDGALDVEAGGMDKRVTRFETEGGR